MRLRLPTSLLLCALALQAGCVMLPIPTQEHKVLAGKPVSEEQLVFLTPGVTTQREVVERLGQPDAIWEEARLYAYDWVMRQGILLWAIGGGYSGAAGMMDLPRNYQLLIRFDDEDRVQRFERAVRPSLEPYGQFLERWVAGSGTKSSGASDQRRD
jgi:outer membrane protein assembly factor BamE (lipoprotein component of BamABCDE complex)